MKVLALASYPVEAAATRYRLTQFVEPLRERGIELDVRPFLNSRLFASLYRREQLPRTAAGLAASAFRRFADVARARAADVVLVQREAMMFGPPAIEWLTTRIAKRPMVLDLDDATYVSYTSPTYGRLASALKWFSKTDDLIRWAKVVTCGNRYIAGYVSGKGAEARIIPTVVDTERFRPAAARERGAGPPALGWIGTHSTFQYLKAIFPALQELARSHRFRLKVVGAGVREIDLPGVEVESLDWSLEREIADFQSFDVGLYPIVADEWSLGKSGFKAIQYMAVGIPFVVSPVGSCAEIGEEGRTHLAATSQGEWTAALRELLSDEGRRRLMGEAGRRHAVEHYTVPIQADKLAQALRDAAGSSDE
ncbi:MAG TPA: glycosyltransferase family 4 protein [Pyrinomonadaceae bacterium]|nr:glycosyltransferase family 4 protein [Pyrinomonadaceae bacterium]